MRKLAVLPLALAALLAGAVSGSAQTPPPEATAPAPQGAPAPAPQEPPAPAPQAPPQAEAPAAPASATTLCNLPVPPPRALPPEGSGPVVYQIAPCFLKQGGSPLVEAETYLYYIQLRPSLPSQNVWVPYDEKAEQTILDDFKRLWATNFLDDLAIEVTDYVFSNGVVGKMVAYHMEERERVKVVSYEGSKKIDRTKIDEKLKEEGIQLRLDSFLDQGIIRRVENVLRDMMAEKGYQAAVVKHSITPVDSGPKLVNVTFNISEGPKVKIRDIEWLGNVAYGDGTLTRKMEENKPKGIFGFITGGGTYQEAKLEEDFEKVVEFYRDRGYIGVRIGQPEIKVLEDSKDGENRYVQLRIPIEEGGRYRVDEFTFEGNTVVKSEVLRPLFKIEKGEYYSNKDIRKGMEKARELYGSGGYMEFTGYPDLKPEGNGNGGDAQVPEALAEQTRSKTPTVDVVMRLQEGKQYFVNRITFVGNTTTRDNVIRREMRLLEGHIFNTESLKYSIRRLNQLGYFKALEGNDDVQVDKTPGKDNTVDVTLKFEEQNRNQLTFGAGVSQWEGFFGQLAFQTSNFMGRGESLTVSMQAGSRAQNYQLSFSEPFLFDRNITGGIDLYKRNLQYIGYYTQKSTGGNLVFGFPLADFSRMFVSYSYERTGVDEFNELFFNQNCVFELDGCTTISPSDLSSIDPATLERIRRNPFLYDSLLLGAGGKRTISRVTPSFVHNTVDHPISPTMGKRLTASIDLAVLGGNTNYYKPRLEGIWYIPHTRRTSFGFRALTEFIAPVMGTEALPIFEKLFLGGEYSIRGFDIRSVGPSLPDRPGLVLGGNKSLLFNAEYLISIAGPVRLVLFYDAGQVRDEDEQFSWKEDIVEPVLPPTPALFDPFATSVLTTGEEQQIQFRTVGRRSAFKTSTGAEIRFFMPVLNVPFRLIFAMNPQRGGVLDNNLQPAKKFTFRFAVGSTF
jgi:outer membrane protein insertion porin family